MNNGHFTLWKVFHFSLFTFSFSLSGYSLGLNYKGNVKYAQWYYYLDDPESSAAEHVETLHASGEFTLQTESQVELKFSPRFILDFNNGDRNRWIPPDDLYLDYFSDIFEWRGGYQVFSWKTVESVSHADFLNQTDRGVDFLDAPKLGEPSIRTRFVLPAQSEQVIEAYYFFRFTATRFPNAASRQHFMEVENGSGQHVYNGDYSEWMPQAALRYQSTAWDIDFSLFYFNGYDRFPGVIGGAGRPVQEYRKLNKSGLTFQGALGDWLIKGEGVYTHYLHDIKVFNPLLLQNTPFTVDPYFSYTTGFEYTLYSFLVDNHDLGLILEITGDTDAGKTVQELGTFRLFQNHLFGGMRYTFNNVSDRSLLGGGFFDYRKGDVIAQFEYDERLFKHLKIKLKYRGIYAGLLPGVDASTPSLLGSEPGPTSPVRTDFEKLDRLDAELIFTF